MEISSLVQLPLPPSTIASAFAKRHLTLSPEGVFPKAGIDPLNGIRPIKKHRIVAVLFVFFLSFIFGGLTTAQSGAATL